MGVRRIGDACEWFCAQCASSGAVLGWRDSRWDLTQLERDDEVDRSDALVFTRLEELSATRAQRLGQKLRLALALAAAHADYVVVSFSERELAELLDALDECTSDRLVERFAARLDSALLACEARKVEPPTVH
jgi:AcrR family transcriptional regulator